MDASRSANPQGSPDQFWEARVQAMAAAFRYPPTPDVAGGARRRLLAGAPTRHTAYRRLGWAALLLALVLAGLMAVPQVRAAVLESLRIGAIRILLTEPTPTPAPPTAVPSGQLRPAATSAPSPTPLASVLDLSGRTTLAAAKRAVPFTLRLPAGQPGLDEPDEVFVQQVGGGPSVVLAWLDPAQPGQARLALYEISASAYFEKVRPTVIQETEVGGRPAIWAEGPHLLVARDGSLEMGRLVTGHVLIWTEGSVTYRLETGSSLDEARQVAESLQPAP